MWAAFLLLLPLVAKAQECPDVELQPIPECGADEEPDISVNAAGCEEWRCRNFDDYGDDYGDGGDYPDGEDYEPIDGIDDGCPAAPAPPASCPDDARLETFDEDSGCQTGWECLQVPAEECNDAPEPAPRDGCLFDPVLSEAGCVTSWTCVPTATDAPPAPVTTPAPPDTPNPPQPPVAPGVCNDAAEPDALPGCDFEPEIDDEGCITSWTCVPVLGPVATQPPPPPLTQPPPPPVTQPPPTLPPPTEAPRIGLPGPRCPATPSPRETSRCVWQPTVNRWTGCTTGFICLEPAGTRKRPCAVPKRPKNDPACRWRPVVDSDGCTVDFDCEPVYVVPPPPEDDPAAKRWPCPFVEEPLPKPGCKWVKKIHPATLCIAHYECDTGPEPECPGEYEPGWVPYPDDVPECRWFPMFGDDGCVFMYGCERRSGCPEPPELPEERPGCQAAPVIDEVTGCLLEYTCATTELGVAPEKGYTSAYDSASFLQPQEPGERCDPSEPAACTGHREPMEWGCCRTHYRGTTTWAGSGCGCDAVQGRCVIRRWEEGKSHWAYCIPKPAFDCYWNFALAGKECGLKDQPPPPPKAAVLPQTRAASSRTPVARQGPYF